MKFFYIFFALILGNIATSLAQGSLMDKLQKFAGESDTIGHMVNNRYVVSGEGMVAFKDGSQQNGNIEFVIATRASEMEYFLFTPEGKMRAESVGETKVDYFKVNGHTFYPIKLKMDDLTIGNSRIFVEMLHNSPEDPFKMYLLRLVAPAAQQVSRSGDYVLSRSFYVMLPEFKVARGLEDLTFTPFAKKMSGFLKDCPEIAEKVKNKEEGYKYNIFNGAANYSVFYRIMDEYNACKSK